MHSQLGYRYICGTGRLYVDCPLVGTRTRLRRVADRFSRPSSGLSPYRLDKLLKQTIQSRCGVRTSSRSPAICSMYESRPRKTGLGRFGGIRSYSWGVLGRFCLAWAGFLASWAHTARTSWSFGTALGLGAPSRFAAPRRLGRRGAPHWLQQRDRLRRLLRSGASPPRSGRACAVGPGASGTVRGIDRTGDTNGKHPVTPPQRSYNFIDRHSAMWGTSHLAKGTYAHGINKPRDCRSELQGLSRQHRLQAVRCNSWQRATRCPAHRATPICVRRGNSPCTFDGGTVPRTCSVPPHRPHANPHREETRWPRMSTLQASTTSTTGAVTARSTRANQKARPRRGQRASSAMSARPRRKLATARLSGREGQHVRQLCCPHQFAIWASARRG